MAGSVEDWLALPGEEQLVPKQEQPAEKKSAPVALPVIAPEDIEKSPVLSKAALVASDNYRKERAEFTRAWNRLTSRQRIYLRALQRCNFRHAAALKVLNGTVDPDTGYAPRPKVQWQAPARWARSDEDYAVVLAALKTNAVAQATSREDLLLRAHNIAEMAIEGEPVFGRDRADGSHHVIGHEKKLDTALRANEQLMKATKILGDDNRVQVAVGPALVIQVVQKDGGVIDVTPQSVPVDLPLPSGA